MKGPKSIPQGLKPHSLHCIYTGDKSPAYRREEFFRSLGMPVPVARWESAKVSACSDLFLLVANLS
jgi:hypothetical protein